MMDYAALSAIAAVLREGSFERAATVLGVTRSAVSQRVRAIEDRLGTVLIIRGQPCLPTEAGALVRAHVERVGLLEGEMAEAMPAFARTMAQGGRPTLRIAVNADSLAAWFMPALAAFTQRSDALVALVLDDEQRTAERLRSGEVLAAVTADAATVQGCRTIPLGALRYTAVATPAFAARWFARGVDAAALAVAPMLRFDRSDRLQARWAQMHVGVTELEAPTHWVPATQGFLDASLHGIGWSMNPSSMVAAALADGRLVELSPGRRLDVPLHWQHARIGTQLLARLTADVRQAAKRSLQPLPVRVPTPPSGRAAARRGVGRP